MGKKKIVGKIKRKLGKWKLKRRKKTNGEKGPWEVNVPEHWREHLDELEYFVLHLSTSPYTFLMPSHQCHVSGDDTEQLRAHVLVLDERLKLTKSYLVPNIITEDSFWKSYFHFVHIVKLHLDMEHLESDIKAMQEQVMRNSNVDIPSILLDVSSPQVLQHLSNNSQSPVPEQDFDPPELKNAKEYTPVTTPNQRAQICSILPVRLQKKPWQLLYTTREHGISMQTMIRNLADSDETVLFVQTTKGVIFGAFVSESWTLSSGKFYGTGETRLFSFADLGNGKKIKVFKWTKKNSYFMRSDITTGITFGADDSGLSISPDLLKGKSRPSATYGNKTSLNRDPEKDINDERNEAFDVLAIEVWRFFDSKPTKIPSPSEGTDEM